MPANCEGGTPGEKIKVKFISQGEEALFPQLQGKTYTGKSLLTKSIISLDAAVLLTRKRKAGILLDKV